MQSTARPLVYAIDHPFNPESVQPTVRPVLLRRKSCIVVRARMRALFKTHTKEITKRRRGRRQRRFFGGGGRRPQPLYMRWKDQISYLWVQYMTFVSMKLDALSVGRPLRCMHGRSIGREDARTSGRADERTSERADRWRTHGRSLWLSLFFCVFLIMSKYF